MSLKTNLWRTLYTPLIAGDNDMDRNFLHCSIKLEKEDCEYVTLVSYLNVFIGFLCFFSCQQLAPHALFCEHLRFFRWVVIGQILHEYHTNCTSHYKCAMLLRYLYVELHSMLDHHCLSVLDQNRIQRNLMVTKVFIPPMYVNLCFHTQTIDVTGSTGWKWC